MLRKLKIESSSNIAFNRAEQFLYYALQGRRNIAVYSEDIEDAVKLSNKILSASSFAVKNAKIVSGVETTNRLLNKKKTISESDFVEDVEASYFYVFIDLQTSDGVYKAVASHNHNCVSMMHIAQAISPSKFIYSMLEKLNVSYSNAIANSHIVKYSIDYYVKVIKDSNGEPVIETIKEYRFNVSAGIWEEVVIFNYSSLCEEYVCMELPKKLTLMDMWCSNNRVDRKKLERFILNDMLIL